MHIKTWITQHHPANSMDGLRAIADSAGVRYQTVQYWIAVNQVPVRHIKAVSRLTGIPPGDLNPHVAEILDAAKCE